MAEVESRNTMLQNAFVKNADGDYSVKVTGSVTTSPSNTGVAYATSSNSSGVVTSPGAAGAIATTGSNPAGVYDVKVTTFITGTTATADINNCRLLANGSTIGRIITPINGTTGGSACGNATFRVNMAGAGTFSVIAVAAGTTGAIYAASIVADRIQ